MKIDPLIKAALDKFPAPYKLPTTKDHIWLSVPGYKRIKLAGKHPRTRPRDVWNTVRNIERLIETLEKHDD